MNKPFLLLYFLFTMLFSSCTKEMPIEIELPEKDPSIVVNSTIVPFTTPVPKILGVELQSSLSVFDTTKKVLIKDAMVLYYRNNILTDTLKYIDSLRQYIISTSINNYPVTGNEYSIQVIKQGFATVTAKTTIPDVVTLTNTNVLPIAYIDETESATSEVSVAFTDPAGKANFYEVVISDITEQYEYEISTNNPIITSESYYPALVDFKNNKPKTLLFTDSKINGQNVDLKIYYTPPQIVSDHRYISSHVISIHLRNVTEEYYKNKTTFIQHQYSLQEDILNGAGEPINVFSNIHNGYGIFAGYNNSIEYIHIPKILVK